MFTFIQFYINTSPLTAEDFWVEKLAPRADGAAKVRLSTKN
jgi:hypothetical protein